MEEFVQFYELDSQDLMGKSQTSEWVSGAVV